MATGTKKTTSAPAATIKKPATRKTAAATPAKKTAAVTAKKTPAPKADTKKTGAPKAAKPTAAKSTPKKSAKKKAVTPEQRYLMIQHAAYFRAEQRGFAAGYEMEDWIAGEAQIDAMLNA